MTPPSPSPPPAPSSAMLDTVRDRCRALSLPTWRCDTAGVITLEPDEPGLAGLWLRSSQITALISEAAKDWSTQNSLNIRTPFEGAWLIPLIHEQRRRRTGLTLALALSPAALSSTLFSTSCSTSGLDPASTRLALTPLATHNSLSTHHAATSLQCTIHDLAALTDHTSAIQGFTHELTQSFETIDLLYALGRSMLDLRNPERFINLLCDRLFETLPFGYLACQFAASDRINGTLARRLISRGKLPADTSHIQAALSTQSLRASHSTTHRTLIQPITLPPPDGSLAAILVCGDKHGEDPQVSSYDIQLLEAAAGFTGAFLANARFVRDQQAMFLGTLQALTASIDAKDRYTCGHSERVAHLAATLATSLNLDPALTERLHIAGLVHDVGKIGVPESILCKPGRLTPDEFALIQLHPEIGHRILKDIPMLEDVLPAVLHHHERYDGKGYPHGLKGQDIPLFARLICLADTFDAMSSNRSYRSAMTRTQALDEIRRCAGTQFDPAFVDTFIALDFSSYDDMVQRHAREYGAQQRIVHAAA